MVKDVTFIRTAQVAFQTHTHAHTGKGVCANTNTHAHTVSSEVSEVRFGRFWR